MKNDAGLIGLAVMGRNLVLNIERNGFKVSVFNRTYEVTEEFLAKEAKGKKITGHKTLQDFVASLAKPRKIIVMVKAGKPVDEVISQIKPLLEKDDILIDAGNSFYKDTERRTAELAGTGIYFMGMGVSGGEEGALWGPSMMPGGEKSAFEKIAPVLEKIAADSDTGRCTTYIGSGGAGHFVKMVHNGIEYGDMQLIAETYDLLRRGLGMSAPQIAEIFSNWNKGPLKSYLIEITAAVLTHKESGESSFLVDKILDKAGQKGTGGWTVKTAMDEGVAIPTITAAVDARILSSLKDERAKAARAYQDIFSTSFRGEAEKSRIKNEISPSGRNDFTEKLMLALYASKICSYAQGFALMGTVSKTNHYNLNLAEIARIWKGGCIIRAIFLDRIRKAFTQQPDLPNLLMDPSFQQDLLQSAAPWQEVLTFAISRGIPVPAMGASFAYFSSYRTASLPANLIQAQRDFFGAHTYERTDRPGIFHTHWSPTQSFGIDTAIIRG